MSAEVDAVVGHLGLVRCIAKKLHKRLPTNVMLDDLIQDGCLGLLDAAQRFDVSTGHAFGAFARGRILGSMLDGLRSLDPVPRGTRKSGSDPVFIEFVGDPYGEDVSSGPDDVFDEVARREAIRRAEKRLCGLSPSQRAVVDATLTGREFREVAAELGVTPSRVSMLLREAVDQICRP